MWYAFAVFALEAHLVRLALCVAGLVGVTPSSLPAGGQNSNEPDIRYLPVATIAYDQVDLYGTDSGFTVVSVPCPPVDANQIGRFRGLRRRKAEGRAPPAHGKRFGGEGPFADHPDDRRGQAWTAAGRHAVVRIRSRRRGTFAGSSWNVAFWSAESIWAWSGPW